MYSPYESSLSEQQRNELRVQRAVRRKAKLRARRRKRLLQILPLCALFAAIAALFAIRILQHPKQEAFNVSANIPSLTEPVQLPEPEPESPYQAKQTAETAVLSETDISSQYAILVDLQQDVILAAKDAYTTINPASMTKILTLLVAVENLPSLTDSIPITREITDYCFTNGCSVVGYSIDDTPTAEELLYGTILSSGADAALALAYHISGSQEAFVELMNEKITELGLSDTAHFTNCVGLYDQDHTCTVYDMAMILKAAMDNDLCRKVLSTHKYRTAPTIAYPEGMNLSNFFLRRIEDHDTEQPVRTVGAKTGYVVQAGSCAASWGEAVNGNRYICVTGKANSSWRAIYDHVAIYQLCPEQ